MITKHFMHHDQNKAVQTFKTELWLLEAVAMHFKFEGRFCLLGQNLKIEIWLRTIKVKMSDFWQRQIVRGPPVLN